MCTRVLPAPHPPPTSLSPDLAMSHGYVWAEGEREAAWAFGEMGSRVPLTRPPISFLSLTDSVVHGHVFNEGNIYYLARLLWGVDEVMCGKLRLSALGTHSTCSLRANYSGCCHMKRNKRDYSI